MKSGTLPAAAAFLLALVAASPAMAEEAVALVDLKFLKETEQAASVLCSPASAREESDGDDCPIWALQYAFGASRGVQF